MFWCEHIYIAFSTIYVGYLTLRRKSAYLRRKKISCLPLPAVTATMATLSGAMYCAMQNSLGVAESFNTLQELNPSSQALCYSP